MEGINMESFMGYGILTIQFDDKVPSDYELIKYANEKYGDRSWEVVHVESPTNYNGLKNPGTAVLKPKGVV